MNPPEEPQQYVAYPRILGRGPRPRIVRFEAITDAWSIIGPNWAVWAAATLFLIFIFGLVMAPYFIVIFSQTLENPRIDQRELQKQFAGIILASQFISLFAGGIINTGAIWMGVQAARGNEIGFGHMFRFNGQFGKVVLAESLLAFAGIIPAATSFLPLVLMRDSDMITTSMVSSAAQLMAYVALWVLMVFCTFATILIVDRQLSIGEAFRESFAAAKRNFLMLVAVLFVVNILAGLGVIVCGFGLLATYPFYFATRAIMYNDVFGPDIEPHPADVGDFSVPPTATSL